METKSVEELCSYLQDEICVDDEVLSNLKKHKIDGETFLRLNEEYLREVAPLLGDRIKLKRVITSNHLYVRLLVLQQRQHLDKFPAYLESPLDFLHTVTV